MPANVITLPYFSVSSIINAGDRRDVADEIETKLFVQRGIDRVRRGDQEERVAIGGRTDDRLGADITAGTRPIFDDEWLTKPLG